MTDANDAVQPPTYQPPVGYQPPAGYSAPAQPPYGQAPTGYPGQPAYGQPPHGQAPAAYPGQPVYGQNSYGQAQAPYGQAPTGYPAPGYAPYGFAQPSGRKFWALQFMVYIPYVGALVVAIVALVQRGSAQGSPHAIVRENARWAANWALSYLLYLIVLVILAITMGVSTSRPSYDTYDSYGSYSNGSPAWFFAVPVILIFGIGIYWLVTVIRGTVVSDRVVHRPALAIPFFRA